MRQNRFAFLLSFILVGAGGGASIYFLNTHYGTAVRARLGDARCRGGCTMPAFSLLPMGGTPGIAGLGQLTTALGASTATTRASNKSCVNGAGLVTQLGNNLPCVEAGGLSGEIAATNIAIQSNNLGNAAWTSNTLTLVQGDPSCGLDPSGAAGTAWLATPTGGATDSYVFQSVTNGTHAPFAGAIYVKNPTGQTLGRSILMRVDGAGSIGSSTGVNLVSTANWTRYTWTTDLTSDTNSVVRILVGTNSTWLQATGPFCFAFAQLEQVVSAAAASSSYIPTTTVAATRAADKVDVGPVSLLGNTYSISGDFTPAFFNTANNGDLVNVNTDANEQLTARLQTAASNTLDCGFWNGAASFDATSVATFTAGVSNHFSCSYDGTTLKACINRQCTGAAKTFTRAVSNYSHAYLMNDSFFTGLPVMPGHLAALCMDRDPNRCL